MGGRRALSGELSWPYSDVAVLARTLNEFEHHWNAVAEPFDWDFTSADLAELLARLAAHEPALALAA